MARRKPFGLALLCAGVGLALSLPGATPAQENAPVKLGMVKAFFTDLPDPVVGLLAKEFGGLLKATTGLNGTLAHNDDAFATAAKLDKGELQFAVFHGHEFAWMQAKYPKFKPLLVVTNNEHNVQAFVIVRKDCPAGCIANLRGKVVATPAMTKEHCRVFLCKHCKDNGGNEPKAFFKEFVKAETPIDALDDLCRGKVDAVACDSIALNLYKGVKLPTFSKNLRVLEQSTVFPAPVIVYKEGAVKEATLAQFRNGLLQAQNNAQAKGQMVLFMIDAFELPPANYQQQLTNTLKAYPAPR
jgi:ABC-type phosphate/phosphonate transport system substrate-binding protein